MEQNCKCRRSRCGPRLNVPPLQLLQIVPHLPPKISGVGDYAVLLAEELRASHNILTRFLIANPEWDGGSDIGGFPVHKVGARSAQDLRQGIASANERNTPILLQYVGYGYQKRGCPVWLARGLSAALGSGTVRVATMFHELYASGPIWTSAGLTSILQRWIAARLAKISRICGTNRQASARQLEKVRGPNRPRVMVCPVFSNFGEPKQITPLHERPAQAVWFGGLRSNSHGTKEIAQLGGRLKVLGIQKLIAIGSNGLDFTPLNISVERRPTLSSQDASTLLSSSRIGVLDYFDGYLGKSGIFAAYCSHKVLPLLLKSNQSHADGLDSGTHFIALAEFPQDCSELKQEEIAARARQWYDAHNLVRTGELWADAIRKLGAQC